MLFGSDLSQLDKDLIFEGLKKLYKKKVSSSSDMMWCGVEWCVVVSCGFVKFVVMSCELL